MVSSVKVWLVLLRLEASLLLSLRIEASLLLVSPCDTIVGVPHSPLLSEEDLLSLLVSLTVRSLLVGMSSLLVLGSV